MHPITQPEHAEFFQKTVGKWEIAFLGVYIYDEAGGRQIDRGV
jgi:hypothetical protein